jgi:hypothetical protein
MNSASLCSLAGWYENPIPPQCLAPIDVLKIPALKNMHFFIAPYEKFEDYAKIEKKISHFF